MRRVLCHRERWSYLTSRTWTFLSVFLTSMVVTADSFRDLMGRVPVPEFLPGISEVTARQGGEAVLPCSVRHLGTKEVVWRDLQKDQFLTIGTLTWSGNPNVSINHTKRPEYVTDWNLVFKEVRPSDAGTYECHVTSRAGHHKNVVLKVVGPPITRPVPPTTRPDDPNRPVTVCGAMDMHGCLISITGNRWVDLGQKIILRCNASGGMRVPDEIDWFKSGDKIDSEKYRRIIIDKYKSMKDRSFISELVIDRSTLNDTGDYICRSSRNDIANLKVTVLHGAGSEPIKRGTDHHGSWNRDPQGFNGAKSQWQTNVFQPFFLSLLAVRCVQVTLSKTHFGLFS